MNSPDYEVIDDCLKKIVRPERVHASGKETMKQALIRAVEPAGVYWRWEYPSGQINDHLDTHDALAVVSACVIDHLLKTSYCTIEAWASHCGGVQFAASASGRLAYHPDRTTVLCMLALMVAGPSDQGNKK